MSKEVIELINSNVGLYIFGVLHGLIITFIGYFFYAIFQIIDLNFEKKKQLKAERKSQEEIEEKEQ